MSRTVKTDSGMENRTLLLKLSWECLLVSTQKSCRGQVISVCARNVAKGPRKRQEIGSLQKRVKVMILEGVAFRVTQRRA